MRMILGLVAGCWLASASHAAIHLGVDHNGDGLVRLEGRGDPMAPLDASSEAQPFIFWLNTDQDDLDFYETWPLNRADYETDGIDSLRDLEDFTRLVVQVDDRAQWAAARTLQFQVSGTGDALAINLYQAADRECGNTHLLSREGGDAQRTGTWNDPIGTLETGNSLSLAITDLAPPSEDGRVLCFLFEGAHEGLAAIRATLLDGRGNAVDRSADPAWISIRHVKRLYKRVTVPWPEGRKDAFAYNDQPPPLELDWQIDPQGFDFEQPWYQTDDAIVWVYGWLKSGPGLYEMSTVHSGETVFKRLWQRGFRGELTLFHWPTVKQKVTLGLLRSEYRGYKAGYALKDYVESFGPEKRVHVTAHSLGGVPLASAIRAGMKAETALFQVSAVPAEAFDTNPALQLPDMKNVPTPTDTERGGYYGLLTQTNTRIYSFYNTADITFFGWNIAQKAFKESAPWFKEYRYQPNAPEGEQTILKTGLFGKRPVEDPDEIRAFITRARTHAIGAEPRVRGVIYEAYDLDRPPFQFGTGHVVQWAWNPQKTTAFYNLVLDLFNIRYNSEQL